MFKNSNKFIPSAPDMRSMGLGPLPYFSYQMVQPLTSSEPPVILEINSNNN